MNKVNCIASYLARAEAVMQFAVLIASYKYEALQIP
jgi:hypothetical protein